MEINSYLLQASPDDQGGAGTQTAQDRPGGWDDGVEAAR